MPSTHLSVSHIHEYEDITTQADGYNLIFTTTYNYAPSTLKLVYNGVIYTKDNGFSETGAKEITLENCPPFPPTACYLAVYYIRGV